MQNYLKFIKFEVEFNGKTLSFSEDELNNYVEEYATSRTFHESLFFDVLLDILILENAECDQPEQTKKLNK